MGSDAGIMGVAPASRRLGLASLRPGARIDGAGLPGVPVLRPPITVVT